MSTFAFLLLCVQACLIQHVYSQCGCGGNIGVYGNGLATGGLGLGNVGLDLGYGSACAGGIGYGAGLGLGNVLAGSSYAGGYGGYGNGNVVVAGELGVAGSTLVAGQVPVLGAVQFNGNVPAAGAVSISGNCGYGTGCSCGCNNVLY